VLKSSGWSGPSSSSPRARSPTSRATTRRPTRLSRSRTCSATSRLQGLRRPHEAAEALRSFLRLRPDDPEKGAIEERIRTLEEEQRLLDQERGTPTVTPPPGKPIATPPAMGNKIVVDEAGTVAARNQAAEERRKKKIWMGVGISLGVLAVGGVALGLALGLSNHSEPYTPADFGPEPGTR
jgi:hypothetical protein